MTAKRYSALDGIRGLALLNMIAYHAVWDLVYLFDFHLQWYQSEGAYIWQQCICWTFIFLSGFCEPLGKEKLKRGITVFSLGFLIVAATLIAMPQNRVRFGVLTLIGSCMLLMVPLEKFLQKFKPEYGLIFSIALFLLTKNINHGYPFIRIHGYEFPIVPAFDVVRVIIHLCFVAGSLLLMVGGDAGVSRHPAFPLAAYGSGRVSALGGGDRYYALCHMHLPEHRYHI